MKRSLASKLIGSLRSATSAGVLRWKQDKYGDLFESRAVQLHFELKWIYYYEFECSINRQASLLAVDRTGYCFAWGTQGMEETMALRSVVSANWDRHCRSCADSSARARARMETLVADTTDVACASLENQVRLLRMILRATTQGIMIWRQLEPTVYAARLGNDEYSLHVLRPTFSRRRAATVHILRLMVPGVSFDTACGTESMSLLESILSIIDADWKARLEDRNKKVAQAIDTLAAAVRAHGRGRD